MSTILYSIRNSSHIGAFATASENFIFVGAGIPEKDKIVMEEALAAQHVDLTISFSDLVGIFSRANSNGILLSNLVEKVEVERLKEQNLGINIGVVDSELNAIGNNILANDKIAIVNPEYTPEDMKQISDILGVEVLKGPSMRYKTVGASNMLTNKGIVVNNRSTESEEGIIGQATKFKPIKSTANTGSLYLGISAIANSKGAVVGKDTTGFELQRLMEGLDLTP
ncbi:MAG: translation initiation factor IF-6 [Candidatus Micrarchaeia archaeon]